MAAGMEWKPRQACPFPLEWEAENDSKPALCTLHYWRQMFEECGDVRVRPGDENWVQLWEGKRQLLGRLTVRRGTGDGVPHLTRETHAYEALVLISEVGGVAVARPPHVVLYFASRRAWLTDGPDKVRRLCRLLRALARASERIRDKLREPFEEAAAAAADEQPRTTREWWHHLFDKYGGMRISNGPSGVIWNHVNSGHNTLGILWFKKKKDEYARWEHPDDYYNEPSRAMNTTEVEIRVRIGQGVDMRYVVGFDTTDELAKKGPHAVHKLGVVVREYFLAGERIKQAEERAERERYAEKRRRLEQS